jgi:ribosomal protein S18 acetylase RimI-like enzyme
MHQVSIRSATDKDVPSLLSLLREFAEYENLLDALEVNEPRLRAGLFGDGSPAEALIAEYGGDAIGYAIFFPNFASFRGQRGIYLEDIYIQPEHRRHGVGEMMLRQLAAIGASRGMVRIDFVVLDWNTSAIAFYKGLGADMNESERHFRLSDRAFQDLAG